MKKKSIIQEKINIKIFVSTLLEFKATDTERANGLDIADYIIEFKSTKTVTYIQSYLSPTLQSMIKKNKALLMLINALQLNEV